MLWQRNFNRFIHNNHAICKRALHQVHGRIIGNLGNPRGGGIFKDILRRGLLQHTPFIQHNDAAAKLHGLKRISTGINQDRALRHIRVKDIAELFAQLLAQLVIKVHKRLIQQQNARVLDQRACQRNALLLPAR